MTLPAADCAHLIQALNECHAKGVWHKITGGCNGIKHDLNMCLRQEVSPTSTLLPRRPQHRPDIRNVYMAIQRVERTANHIRESRENRKKTEQIWKQIDDES